jgi:hypothetical protein
MNIKCIAKDCQNHKHEGGFTGDLCNPCYRFITTNEANNSQAYRNAKPAKTLTDEEIIETVKDHFIGAIKLGIVLTNDNVLDFARAILRKAQE